MSSSGMNGVERQIAMVDRYTKILSAFCEQGRYADLEHLKQQIDSFEDDRRNMIELCDDIDKLESERDKVRKLIEELKLKKEKLGELEERYQELSEPLQYSESKQKKLFEKCMGLQFRLTEDHAISLVFTNIDPNDLEQRFVITLDVDDQGQWKVIQIDPMLHGVRPLIEELNEKSNFGQFCKHIRQKFQELCSKPVKPTQD